MKLPTAKIPRIRSYVSTPVVLSDGTLYGTFCAFGLTSDKELGKRDKSLMDVLASAAAVIIEPELRAQERRDGDRGPARARSSPTAARSSCCSRSSTSPPAPGSAPRR